MSFNLRDTSVVTLSYMYTHNKNSVVVISSRRKKLHSIDAKIYNKRTTRRNQKIHVTRVVSASQKEAQGEYCPNV